MYNSTYTIMLLKAKVSSILPLLILGLCSIVGALATFFLPETAGRKLPQTLEDGSQFGLDQSRNFFGLTNYLKIMVKFLGGNVSAEKELPHQQFKMLK